MVTIPAKILRVCIFHIAAHKGMLMSSLLSHNDFEESLRIIATQSNDWNGVCYVVRDSRLLRSSNGLQIND